MSRNTNQNAATTSEKKRNFMKEPMGEKDVTALPAIGEISGEKLKAKGYGKAKNVYGVYLLPGTDKNKFVRTIVDKTGIRVQEAEKCYDALEEYHTNHS
ncbi:barrier-to-autointegration factor-like [Haliotis cracherodii]|uniref:barrier-to-autointegration factor-like n=1 Tax=Haliotis cracherodii TaxID=6455 RepID=UPI0039ECCB4B